MCGFAGFLHLSSRSTQTIVDARAIAEKMAEQLVHRGPDDQGVWADASSGIAFGFARLAIIDLSPAGSQPMASPCGRYRIVFNGEIYNHRQLREELQNEITSYRGSSDTEVFLAAIQHWGLQRALARSNGMFAFALWDTRERRLQLGRDRLGEKPLYYARFGDILLFGSELRALRAHPAFQSSIDRDALALYLRHVCIPAPYSIYKNVRKLTPGSILTIEKRTAARLPVGELPAPQPYWSMETVVSAGAADPFRATAKEAADETERLLRASVARQMVADVPLGAFLSGGIDSSLIVALMQAQQNRQVRTFSIGFHEDSHNEAQHAKHIAQHLGTEHTELYVTAREALDVIPRLPTIYDEPFADGSQIPTYLVSRLARKSVTVALSGDGGDELFCGYPRYQIGDRRWRAIGWLPRRARVMMGYLLSRLAMENRYYAPAGSRRAKAIALAQILRGGNFEASYKWLMSYWKEPAQIVRHANEPLTTFDDSSRLPSTSDRARRMMTLDAIGYLPDDILAKVDRAAMSVSLETRVPMLDHHVVEFSARLPQRLLCANNQPKWILKDILGRYVPPEMFDRPKMGFGIPIGSWLRGPLRDWAETLLSESSLTQNDLFSPEPIRAKWREFLAGERDWGTVLWPILSFQTWINHTHNQRPATAQAA